MHSPPRRPELDALRGLAALSVVALHCLIVLPVVYEGGEPAAGGAPDFLSLPFVRALWAGPEAVVLFFVLSGLVLSLPFWRGPVDTRAFLARRVLRIYPPYLFAVLLAVIASVLVPHAPNPAASVWFNAVWSEPLTAGLVFDHLLLLGSFDNDALVPVFWSLVVEMRISLVFPLIMVFLLRVDWRRALLAAVALYVVGRGFAAASETLLGWPNDIGQTLMHVYQFVVGALVARHLDALGARYRRLGRWRSLALLIAALALYRYRDFVPGAVEANVTRALGQFPTTLAIAVIIVAACFDPALQRVLRWRPLVWLGTVSYSLYLLHAIVLVALVHLRHDASLPGAPTFVWVFALSLALSALAYALVERPSIAASRRWFGRGDAGGDVGGDVARRRGGTAAGGLARAD